MGFTSSQSCVISTPKLFGFQRRWYYSLAEYITGIGRDGAKPFPVTIVYMREGKGFKILEKESEVLTSRRVKTVREAQRILRDEFQYLP
ncbi:MAG: hypothetical protein HC903_28460 [Methylacidiphilales bacterium]|nr:hypothetical protein [Candidatus Methylacidiphilales bacterium]